MKLGNDAKKMKTRESNSLEVGVLTLEGSERQNMGGCRTRFLGSIYHDLSHTATREQSPKPYSRAISLKFYYSRFSSQKAREQGGLRKPHVGSSILHGSHQNLITLFSFSFVGVMM